MLPINRRDAVASLLAAASMPAGAAPFAPMIRPFEISLDPTMLGDLSRRLDAARWPDAVTDDWSYGTNERFLQTLVRRWRFDYRWPDRVAALNRLPHRMATMDGYDLHFLHYRSSGGGRVPLLLMNGWPSSFVEYQKLAPLLSGGTPSFDVVIPTLPGFGFSQRPNRPFQIDPVDLYPQLMTSLGYERFVAAGTDLGSGVATRIALRHPNRLIALHVSTVATRPQTPDDPPSSTAELDYERHLATWERDEGGYLALQNSRPQTPAYALADSPVGLAGWIVEKFRAWSDCAGDVLAVWPADTLLDNLMIYWSTNTIGSSMRYNYDASRLRPPLLPSDRVRVPTAVAVWPRDLNPAPRELADRLYDVRRYTRFARGGHFPAWEVPNLYVDDLRAAAQL